MTDIHTCSYHCERPACIKAQRDRLRDGIFKRRPMRDEMIAQGRANCAFGGQELLGAFFQGWEAAERAHGIGDE